MKAYKVVYWVGQVYMERLIVGENEDEIVDQLTKNRKDLVKIEQVEEV